MDPLPPNAPLGLIWAQRIEKGETSIERIAMGWGFTVDEVARMIAVACARYGVSANQPTQAGVRASH